jgi:hypothetical protein
MNYFKDNLAEGLTDSYVSSLGRRELEQIVWDIVFNEMVGKSWGDLRMAAEDHAPHLLDSFPF